MLARTSPNTSNVHSLNTIHRNKLDLRDSEQLPVSGHLYIEPPLGYGINFTSDPKYN